MKNATNYRLFTTLERNLPWAFLARCLAAPDGIARDVRGAARRPCRASAIWGAQIEGRSPRCRAASGNRNRSTSPTAGAR